MHQAGFPRPKAHSNVVETQWVTVGNPGALALPVRGTTIMQTKNRFMGIAASALALSLLGTLPGVAQDVDPSAQPPAPSGGWRKFQPQDGAEAANQPGDPAGQPTPPQAKPQDAAP